MDKKIRLITGQVPLEDDFRGLSALKSIAGRFMHSAARSLPMHPDWRAAIHRWRGAKIGKGVFIGSEVFIDNAHPQGIVIEDNVVISFGCYLISHFIGPLHLRNILDNYGMVSKGIVLKEGCYLGPCCIVTDGVTVGRCSIVGVGSVVTRDIPDYSIALGYPARVIRKFTQGDVEDFLK